MLVLNGDEKKKLKHLKNIRVLLLIVCICSLNRVYNWQMARNLTANWEIEKIVTDNWHFHPPPSTPSCKCLRNISTNIWGFWKTHRPNTWRNVLFTGWASIYLLIPWQWKWSIGTQSSLESFRIVQKLLKLRNAILLSCLIFSRINSRFWVSRFSLDHKECQRGRSL